MIQSLELENFQSHKHTLLEFSDGVNVIVGPSDSGKTALIRALRWVIWNRPSGDAFRSSWGGDTCVTLCVDNALIDRSRSNSDNKYTMDDITFEALKTDVPAEIQNLLNTNEINLQSQHDAPFLISETAGNVAEFLNRIANLDKIDKGTSNINSSIRRISQDISYKENSLKTIEEQIAAFTDLEKLEAEVEVLETMQQQSAQIERALLRLESLIDQLHEVENRIDEYVEILLTEDAVNNLLTLVENRDKQYDEVCGLQDFISEYQQICDSIDEQDSVIPAGAMIDNLLTLYKQYNESVKQKDAIARILDALEDNATAGVDAERAYEQYHELFEQNMGDTCILCGSKLKKR